MSPRVRNLWKCLRFCTHYFRTGMLVRSSSCSYHIRPNCTGMVSPQRRTSRFSGSHLARAQKGVRSMDFVVQQSDLLKELNVVRNAVEKRNTIPILSHFLLETEGFELKITATDLEIAARTVCQAKVRTKGAAVVPGLRFLEIVRSAANGEIRCRSLENHSVQVTYGRASFKLVGLAKSDFPKFPAIPEPIAKLDSGLLG